MTRLGVTEDFPGLQGQGVRLTPSMRVPGTTEEDLDDNGRPVPDVLVPPPSCP